MNIEELLTLYRELLAEVSTEADRLNRMYDEYMVCKKGCSDCCTNLSLLPLEWYALKAAREKEAPSKSSQQNDPGRCSMLVNECCLLYPFRPLICRTHGLPLLYMIEEYNLEGQPSNQDEPEWQISWCELNFTEVTEESMEDLFDPEDVLNMEEWNLRLKSLNQDFLELEEGMPFLKQKRIPIAEIFN